MPVESVVAAPVPVLEGAPGLPNAEPDVGPAPLEGAPKAEPDPLEGEPKVEPVPLEGDPNAEPVSPGEAIPAALPRPELAIPASGCPKNPFTVVFASPTWISRQSSFPVMGSIYRWRKYLTLLLFSNSSIEPG